MKLESFQETEIPQGEKYEKPQHRHKEQTPEKADYDDIIESIRRLRDGEGEKTLEKLGEDLRRSIIKDGISTLAELPSYAGLAFRGKIRILKKEEITKRRNEDRTTNLESIRGKGVLQIQQDAASAWMVLTKTNPVLAWIALELIASGDPKKQKRLPLEDELEAENNSEEIYG